jgi:hypothetical protein
MSISRGYGAQRPVIYEYFKRIWCTQAGIERLIENMGVFYSLC